MKRKLKGMIVMLAMAALTVFGAGCNAAEWFDQKTCTHGNWGAPIVKAATCTEKGEKTRTCLDCGKTETEEIAALGHTVEVIPGKAATCTEKGLTDGEKCSVCGEVLVAQEEIAAFGHTLEIIPGKAATCMETGLTAGQKCSTCNEVFVAQEELAALGHTVETLEAVEATCTETGLTAGEKCSVCGEVLVAQEEIAALGHDYIGIECSRCGEVTEPTFDLFEIEGAYTEVALNEGDTVAGKWIRMYYWHDEEIGEGGSVLASFNLRGSAGEIITVHPDGFSDSGYSIGFNDFEGYRKKQKYVDYHFEIGDVLFADNPVGGVSITITEDTVMTTFQHSGVTHDPFLVRLIPNHSTCVMDSGKVTKEATCTEKGEITRTCLDCGRTETEEIAALGHTEYYRINENNTHTTLCEVCDSELETVSHTEIDEWISVQDADGNILKDVKKCKCGFETTVLLLKNSVVTTIERHVEGVDSDENLIFKDENIPVIIQDEESGDVTESMVETETLFGNFMPCGIEFGEETYAIDVDNWDFTFPISLLGTATGSQTLYFVVMTEDGALHKIPMQVVIVNVQDEQQDEPIYPTTYTLADVTAGEQFSGGWYRFRIAIPIEYNPSYYDYPYYIVVLSDGVNDFHIVINGGVYFCTDDQGFTVDASRYFQTVEHSTEEVDVYIPYGKEVVLTAAPGYEDESHIITSDYTFTQTSEYVKRLEVQE